MSSATALPLIPQIEITEADMNSITPAATPEKRKRSVASDTVPKRPPKLARLDSLVPTVDESLGSTIHYGVYMHDLLKEPENAAPQLVAMSTEFASTYEAMRRHAARQIEANVHWGATKELNTNNLYEILDGKNRILLRYELDAVSPAGQDVNGVQIWERVSASPAPPVHYGMYIDLHCDAKDRAEQFFIGGFKSLGEAKYAMKQSAAMYLDGHGETKLYEKSIEVMNEKGQLQRRFTIEKGRLSENGSFVRAKDWPLEQDSTDSKIPVIRLPTPETSKSPEPPTAQPAPVVSEPQAVQGTRRQSQRHYTPIPPVNKTKEEQPKSKSQAKSKAPAKPKTPAKPKSPPKPQIQTLHDPNPYCTCRLPDDGSLMIGCDNGKCPIGWYHGGCIGILQAIPETEEWYCELCTREMDNKTVHGIDKSAVKVTRKTPVKKGGRGDAKAKAKKRKLS